MDMRNDKVFNDKKTSHAGYLPVQNFAPFMVFCTMYGEPRPVYGGVYMVGGHGERYFYPT
jgi:hypothetical protein